MVWKALKAKSDMQAKSDNGESKKTTKRACKCGERCKRCSDHCKCGTKRVLVRPPMFNYFTDMMH